MSSHCYLWRMARLFHRTNSPGINKQKSGKIRRLEENLKSSVLPSDLAQLEGVLGEGRRRQLPDLEQIGLPPLHRTLGHVIQPLALGNPGKCDAPLSQDRLGEVEVGRGLGGEQEVAVRVQLLVRINKW